MKLILSQNKPLLLIVLALIFSLAIAYFSVETSLFISIGCTCLFLGVIYFIIITKEIKFAFYGFFIYCFAVIFLYREISPEIPFGIGVEVFLLLAWISVFFNSNRIDWKYINNDLVYLALFWFIISVIEVINPAGASVRGWLQEIRSSALYFVIIVPLAFVVFNTQKDMNYFLILIIGISVLATLYGVRQLYFGLTNGEQRFLDEGAAKTHLLWGKLRVFSFFSDAGQFGASQAYMCLITFILALGPFKWWKKAMLITFSLILFYGMLISGTRGALFALVVGGFVGILLSKNFKVLFFGTLIAVTCLGVLKFTNIGNNNYNIYRLRTALDPQDASLNVRFINQKILSDYLNDLPFGGGLGVIGTWGKEYNKDKFLSTIEPDSYWVKVWTMYGIVGFVIWFCLMMYIIGKCCGIVWQIKDKGLKVKLIALTSGSVGIFFCSYGNEVMNTMPTALILYLSWVFVYRGASFDKEIKETNNFVVN